ncbi:hypothetical protein C3747_110g50 [Trypanosoma cruzi]|uniref:Peroxisome assembly protein 22 n=2 Tax=Trypanosoma cruzi TaxID=5693 RepID=Q4DZU9_TRYCC|nr:hypothetical protein, conserved [Trypanosoma cruzi]EAN98054.1 hypothetical protein, conserved [Trypanosoma cruzi]KAF5221120.1 hypothetical protein ECC02_005832 [Trypanosoma cruzi]KAF8290809.1 hypothetical protein TcYC6_0127480 [Trypanosoma cruzi]PWV06794.1 hypothetical protein C3747_110g50 [Trypanosoma cruzi]RNC56072.1 hypothetical protein TcCL_ESM06382 [Trypanosoma cruzi]|eukprot:XP_819905.1 hypothetical protein [Trypanosoma cruzi strain CL Brener]
MARKPLFEVIWQSMTASNAWLVFAAAVGAVSFYVFLLKSTPRGNGRVTPSISNSKDGKPSLLNRMRQQQFKGHRVCIAWEVLAEQGQWRDHAKEALVVFAVDMEVYVMCRVNCKQEKNEVLAMLTGISGLVRHRILFCETAKGYESFCRQIKPALVVIQNEVQASFLSTVLPNVVLVGANVPGSTVTCISSIYDLLLQYAA